MHRLLIACLVAFVSASVTFAQPRQRAGRQYPPQLPGATVKIFAEAMTQAGNRCELAAYEGEVHGFFNYGRGGNAAYVKTVRQMDKFLAEVGFLEGSPAIE